MQYKYAAIQIDPGKWMVHRTDENGELTERLMIVPPDWYEQQVIQKAIAEDSWA